MFVQWATDLHLNHSDLENRIKFFDSLSEHPYIIVTGDIAESLDLSFHINKLAAKTRLYFVVGNHDFYRSYITNVENNVRQFNLHPTAHYLHNQTMGSRLENGIYLVGVNGWADAGYGDFFENPFVLNDCKMIHDFYPLSANDLYNRVQRLGVESAENLRAKLLGLPLDTQKVVVATHVPPFEQCHYYEGKPSDRFMTPHFTCKAVGDVLMWFADAYPNISTTVICGHTHHAFDGYIKQNLRVVVGHADYGIPKLQPKLEI